MPLYQELSMLPMSKMLLSVFILVRQLLLALVISLHVPN
jgi:hypothetical protein